MSRRSEFRNQATLEINMSLASFLAMRSMMARVAGEIRLIAFDDLVELLACIFQKHGVSGHNARILATNCASCERDGSLSHGIFRIPGYIASLKSGWVDGKAVPRIEEDGSSFLRVDAMNGFAQLALTAATPFIHETVAKSGVVAAAMRRSHHFSALWPDLEPFAEKGLVAITMVTGFLCVAAPGGRRPVLGTNPIAFATPVAGKPPLIFDFATSAMSNGDLRLAARAGHKVPNGTGIDSHGNYTDEPADILKGGALLPFGGHKSTALSLMVEILASALTCGLFSHEVDFSKHPGAETPNTGQMLLVIDPERGGNSFAARVLSLTEKIRASGDVRLPSDHRYARRAGAEKNGIPIAAERLAELRMLAS
ncbi:Ldh family oxidoreductase [Mesorhizobium sp. BAC0120]|uniref:Ldh family oxidoreductase n=1 Tax=Mesorhizobium sp. BAC0120 TaxID=3090670 RepID=UPI00298CC1B6|nr:Ldh family oxidoreductase [Mesorhizobium sp. BAC0120]MDW6023333.1 Ldh family oxidoreductase [Mesorhizobium sp. BAC0120]